MAKKYLKAGLGLLSLATVAGVGALTLTSCSGSINEYNQAKIVNIPEYSGIGVKTSLDEATKENANVSVYDLVEGTNSFNKGKYLFIYGTFGYSDVSLTSNNGDSLNIQSKGTTSKFLEWLIGPGGPPADYWEKNQFKNIEIGNKFFDNWFNKDEDIHSPFQDVKIVSYIDIPPVTEDDGTKQGLEKFIKAEPFATWSNEDVLKIYQWHCLKEYNQLPDITTYEELPINWKLLSGTYIRQDKGAEEYRKFVKYATELRPGISAVTGDGNNKQSGMIAFNTTKRNPISYSLEDAQIVTTGDLVTGTVQGAGATWQSIFRLYNGLTWEELITGVPPEKPAESENSGDSGNTEEPSESGGEAN